MTDLLQQWDSFKFKKFEPSDEVFEFLRLANVNHGDMMEKWEAIGFYHGYKTRRDINGNNRFRSNKV